MSNKTLTYLLGAVLSGMMVIFFSNVATFFYEPTSEKYLDYNFVRGMAVEHKGKKYTLNFEQQNQVTQQLNQAIHVRRQNFEQNSVTPNFERIIIYLFDEPDLVISPIGFVNNQLIFEAADWNPDGYLRETGPGVLKSLLSTTYDP